MIRSLRVRFFLITWPVIVLTLVGVAFAVDRWVEVTLTTQSIGGSKREAPSAAADSVVAAWTNGAAADSVTHVLREIARRDSLDLVIVNAQGAIAATSDSQIRLVARREDGRADFVSAVNDRGRVTERVVSVDGNAIVDRSGAARGTVYALPRREAGGRVEAAAVRASARRTLVVTVAIASAVAGLLALVLAFPLVRQVERLGAGAARVRRGDFGARVAVSSRDELGRMEQSFNEMAAELERADTHKRNLAHDVAHELRTPLTNIMGTIEAMQDGLRAPDAATLATLHAEVDLLAVLVNDLQDLSLAESGQLHFDLAPVDVIAESAAAIDAMRASATDVSLVAPTGPPLFARADARRLRQVLRNLLHNAVTYSRAGGVVSVEVQSDAGEVAMRVRDTGIGIPAEHLDLIWERFHRIDPSRNRAGGGRGLGLAIVKQFVERMHGRVEARSVEHQGSTFEIRLPRA